MGARNCNMNRYACRFLGHRHSTRRRSSSGAEASAFPRARSRRGSFPPRCGKAVALGVSSSRMHMARVTARPGHPGRTHARLFGAAQLRAAPFAPRMEGRGSAGVALRGGEQVSCLREPHVAPDRVNLAASLTPQPRDGLCASASCLTAAVRMRVCLASLSYWQHCARVFAQPCLRWPCQLLCWRRRIGEHSTSSSLARGTTFRG